MKYQIRKSVWESNSSSMHSLVVTKKNSNVRMTQEEIRDEFYLNEEWYKERHKNDEKEIVRIDRGKTNLVVHRLLYSPLLEISWLMQLPSTVETTIEQSHI